MVAESIWVSLNVYSLISKSSPKESVHVNFKRVNRMNKQMITKVELNLANVFTTEQDLLVNVFTGNLTKYRNIKDCKNIKNTELIFLFYSLVIDEEGRGLGEGRVGKALDIRGVTSP